MGTTDPESRAPEMREMRRQFQDETVPLAVPALFLAAVAAIQFAPQFRDPKQPYLLVVGLFGLGAVVLALRRARRRAAAWVLTLGSLGVVLGLAWWAGIDAAVGLVALPVGLASVVAGGIAGVLVALGSTVLILIAPPLGLAPGGSLQAVALTGLWGTLGIIWLAVRPILTTLQWSWSSYEQNQRLLDQTRGYQVQLKQALEDLASANRQLTRVNQLLSSAREAAEEARRAKERFTANVSHELRTPLNMIVGFTELIVEAPNAYGVALPPALLADLAVVHRNSQHLSSLIDDVLDLSQVEAGRMALSRERVAIAEVVESAVEAIRPLFQSKGLTLETDVPADLPAVLCDRTRIREVVLNLLSNAGRFTERGKVEVRGWLEHGEVVVSTADTGPGIADADRKRVFQPFEQLEGSLRRHHGGTGLGLAICRHFVELHGGQMWLESREGQGTTFYFRLPVDAPPHPGGGATRWLNPEWELRARTSRAQLPAAPVRDRLVVAEDGTTLKRLLVRYMDDVEVTATSGLEAARAELERVPALALVVNDASVGAALQRLGQSGGLPRDTLAIVCSVPGGAEAAGDLGVSDYLTKPVSRERLLAILDRLGTGGRTILIVDDDQEALQLVRRMIVSSRPGYRVLRAVNGRQALDIARSQRPDAILLDLVMPGMDGFAFLEARAEDSALRAIPVIVVSARDPSGGVSISNALGIVRESGLSTQQLLACIEAISRILSPVGQAGGPPRRGASPE